MRRRIVVGNKGILWKGLIHAKLANASLIIAEASIAYIIRLIYAAAMMSRKKIRESYE